MDEIQPGVQKPVARRLRRILLFIAAAFALLIMAGYLFLFFGLNYFGEKLLRNYLRDKVIRTSDSLYRVDFTALHLNILTGRVQIDSLQLVPDTARYRALRLEGKTARSLYQLSLGSVVIDRVHYTQILAGRRINFRQLIFERPRISIVAYPDTSIQKHRRWRVVYDDIYPVVSAFFNDFHIDSVRVNRGLFLSSSLKSGRSSQGDYEFSSLLKDVAVNPFSYYNRERVFYSRSVDLVVHNFEYFLADSLYRLSADEIGFSLTRSHIFGKKIELKPDLSPEKMHRFTGSELFAFELPGFSIDGLDLYRAMTTRQVHIDSVNVADLSVSVYHNQGTQRIKQNASISEKRILSGIYAIVSKEIRELSIDTVAIRNASFRYFSGIRQKDPELRIGEVSLGMSGFLLDSLSGYDDSRILYANQIELLLNRFSLLLKDEVHRAEAARVSISTRQSAIDVYDCTILPEQGWRVTEKMPRVNLLDIRVPYLGFRRIDLRKMFNHRIVDFNTLNIREPEVRFLRVRRSSNPDPRFRKPKDFFEQENEEVVYAILKRYLSRIAGDSIALSRGFARISTMNGEQEVPVAAGSFDLTMRQFTLDSLHGMNREGFFYSRDFGLDLWSVTMRLASGNGMVEAGKISLRSADSTITAHDLHVSTHGGASPLSMQHGTTKSLAVDFSLDSLRLNGLDHRALFLDQVVIANEIRVENPVLLVKAISRLNAAGHFQGPTAEPAPAFFQAFEVKKCVIHHGTMNYDGEEDRRSSHFRLNDINFNLVNARVVLPGNGNTGGVVRFDSLQLHVLPFRAMLADSTYALEAGSLEIRSYPVNIRLRAVKVIPLNPDAQKRFAFTIPEIRVKGFYFDRAIFEKKWNIDSVAIEHPVAEIRYTTGKMADRTGLSPADAPLFPLPLFMKELDVERISLSDAYLQLSGVRLPGGRELSLHGIKVTVDNLHLDSADATRSPVNILTTSRIQFSAPGFPVPMRDSLYTLTFSRFGFDTGREVAWIDSLAMTPLFSRNDMMGTSRYGADRMEWITGRIDIKKIRMTKLFTEKVFQAGLVSFSGFSFGMFHDKRVVVPVKPVRPMPQEMIRRINIPLVFDSVVVNDAYVEYEEQTGETPGKIYFDRTGVVLTDFSTYHKNPEKGNNAMILTAKARLMGEGVTSARITFFRDHPRDSFAMEAVVTSFGLNRLNVLIPYLTPVSVKTGFLDSLTVIGLNGNNQQASGKLNIRYHAVTLNLQHDKTRYGSRFGSIVLNELLNILLPDDHPLPLKADKTGKILYIRDSHKGFLNFVWKSVLNGIISDLGFERTVHRNLLKTAPETITR